MLYLAPVNREQTLVVTCLAGATGMVLPSMQWQAAANELFACDKYWLRSYTVRMRYARHQQVMRSQTRDFLSTAQLLVGQGMSRLT